MNPALISRQLPRIAYASSMAHNLPQSALAVVGKPPMPKLTSAKPKLQRLHVFDEKAQKWRRHAPKKRVALDEANASQRLNVLTWNVDFARPNHTKRLGDALSHVQSILQLKSSLESTALLFQELKYGSFPTLLASTFVRQNYAITDINEKNWQMPDYGSVTLIPRPLSEHVASVFRAPFPTSRMGRDALYVDIIWRSMPSTSESTTAAGLDEAPQLRRLRIGNVHLESLAQGKSDRARQLESVSSYLSCTGISAGIVAGDMNALSDAEDLLPQKVGLKDAWEVPGWEDEDKELGHTWGYHPRSKWPPRRFDKMLYIGAVRVGKPERVGVGLKGDGAWVSDHFGLLATAVVG